jgi:hypothetical protein
LSILATLIVAGCKDNGPISHAPTHLIVVSGANQSGDVSTALSQPLVIQALDGVNKAVSGVPIAWTVAGGGTLSANTSTTDKDGKATVTWTLSPAAGVQVVTATSTQLATGASVSFVANNGATISGTITPAGGLPFGASFSRTSSRSARLGTQKPVSRRLPVKNRIVVGFSDAVLGVASAGSASYSSMAVARQTLSRMQTRVSAFVKEYPLSHAEISPAMLAARLRVDDTLQVDAVMQALRSTPGVSWVERDETMTIHDGAPRPMAVQTFPQFESGPPTFSTSVVARLPNDPIFYQQYWPSNMIDLPRAWSITTGSANVLVASVDMGIRFDHPDVAANLTNDGYDFVSGITVDTPEEFCDGTTFTSTTGDGDGPDTDPTDPDDIEFDDFFGCWDHNTLGDHGLWTAGIIGAAGNDAVGGSGVAWAVKIRPIRVLDITGSGFNFDIAQGILYAAGLPATGAGGAMVQAAGRAQIINVSLGGPSPSNTLRSAVNAANAAGSLIVASAGNDGLDLNSYPAAFPGVMAVSSVGMDGGLATYSNGGTFISVAAPGGDFRFDDNGGGGVLGPGWNFSTGRPNHLFGYGTSASAPYVSGIAALLLAQTPTLTAAQLRQRIEQFATRPEGFTRSDVFGWGIVNAYNSLAQQNGPPRRTLVRLVDATSGAALAAIPTTSGNFAFTRIPTGSYYVQAGDDESGDGIMGTPGRRFGWAGGFGTPTVFNVNGNAQTTAIVLGVPTEVEPNDDIAHANLLTVGGYVTGNITTPDVRDMYRVTVVTAGVYTFETSGVVGSCGLGIELDTFLTLSNSTGVAIGTNDNFSSPTGRFCSRIQQTLQPGTYYITVTGTAAAQLANHGRYRLEVRAGS